MNTVTANYNTSMGWGISKSLNSTALLWIFAEIISGRRINFLFSSQQARQRIMVRFCIGVLLYLLAAMGTVFPHYRARNQQLGDE